MPEILFHYERVNPTSWAYLSSLLMLALCFKFNRVFSMRNVDLFLLILLAPGLLLVQWAWENKTIADNALQIEYFGFLWLLTVELLLLGRMLFDNTMVRRPLLDPNLNAAGLLFMGSSLLFFLMANVVTGDPKTEDMLPARQTEEVRIEETSGEVQDSFADRWPRVFSAVSDAADFDPDPDRRDAADRTSHDAGTRSPGTDYSGSDCSRDGDPFARVDRVGDGADRIPAF